MSQGPGLEQDKQINRELQKKYVNNSSLKAEDVNKKLDLYKLSEVG